jgi:hypothetical protein
VLSPDFGDSWLAMEELLLAANSFTGRVHKAWAKMGNLRKLYLQ